MSALGPLLREVTAALSRAGAPFALVGGLAVSVRTEPRFTRDVDLAVAATDDQEAERTVRHLAPPYQILQSLEHDRLARLASVRLGRADHADVQAVVDLLFASSGIEPEITAAATPLEVLPDVRLPVARTGHLLALKLLSRDERRPRDEVDLQALLEVATPTDLEDAAGAIDLITHRGGARDRDLRGEWQRVLEQRAGGA